MDKQKQMTKMSWSRMCGDDRDFNYHHDFLDVSARLLTRPRTVQFKPPDRLIGYGVLHEHRDAVFHVADVQREGDQNRCSCFVHTVRRAFAVRE